MTRRGALRAVAAAAAAALCGLAGPSYAADETQIDHVEVAVDGTVSVLLAVDGIPAGAKPQPGSVEVTVDGTPVTATAKQVKAGEIERTTVLALDASNSMRGPRWNAAKAAAKAFLAAAPSDVRIGLVTFAGDVRVVSQPTADHAALVGAIDDIELTAGTQVYDAVVEAVEVAGNDGARSVLVLSDGQDEGRGAPIEDAIKAATDNAVVVDAVAINQAPEHLALLARIADSSGGAVVDADQSALAKVLTAQAYALSSQLLVTFPQPKGTSGGASVAVTVTAGGTTYRDSAFVTLASIDTGASALPSVKPLIGPAGLLVGGLALGLGLTGILAVVLIGARRPTLVQQQIAYFSGQAEHGGKSVRSLPGPTAPSLKDSAVSLTEKLVKGDLETRLATKLYGAGSKISAAEWLLLHAGIAVGAAFVGFVIRGAALALVLLVIGGLLPWVYLKVKHGRRLAAFNAQLAETLTLMAGGLSAGLSMPQAVDTVVREGHEPMAGELRRALAESRLGVDIADALDGVARRMDSEDFSWVVMALRIQREVGGNLAELLNTVADTLREREFLRRQVKVLSAEGRFSAWILGALPPVMFVYMLLVRPEFVRPLYTELTGLVLLATAIGLLMLGFFTLSRLVKVEV
ncbi:type II secretion system F family protein [Nocardioides speluncae]|uniref:type II secretion system F family protein n=1 Tax=Nocardioides speluncae TaxID=2670337 RepID=UPI000D68AA95|nr:type II secretion system F family protein [Nocardioides speluncae]